MKIYTRTGDDGTTGLIGGSRVSKTDPRIEVCGQIDELNAAMGWVACASKATPLMPMLQTIQRELFVVGSILAAPDPRGAKEFVGLDEQSVSRLESEIDAADERLPKLANFILPGGSELAARLHLARAVCRRAERRLIAALAPPAHATTLRYLNRLSDWLFVQARWANQNCGVPDVLWSAQERG